MRTLQELMNLRGRTALVTGGAGHIGGAILETLAELGAATAVADRSELDCKRRAEHIESTYGQPSKGFATDLQDEDSTRGLIHRILEWRGSLSILVHCAAFVGTTDFPGWGVPFEQQSVKAWEAAMRVNLTAAFVLAQEAASALKASGHGSIVLVSSTYGMVGPDWSLYEGTDMSNPAGYGASKGGLLQLSRYLATRLAPEVRVNTITPGGVRRGQPEAFHVRYKARTPLQRMADEEDFKGAAAYLASDLSAYVTGQNLVVDGGWTAW